MKKTIRVTVNGRLYEEDVEPRILLSHFLRETIGLTGSRSVR
jgi:aerobic-type carbon monoxide dehydrogenase small subunit (CoxS/CutS family)